MSGIEAGAMVAVVVSHESGSTIDECLRRLRDAAGVSQVRVVDNGSTDDTLATVQRQASADPRLRFIGNPDNPGFAVACNQGAADSDAPWILFVNPDCFVDSDAPSRLLAHAIALQAERGCDVLLGADLRDPSGTRDAAARRRAPDFAAMLVSPAARDLSIAVDPSRDLQPVEAISGAVMLLPRTLFDRIGGFDEGYRLHAEDLDLCRRVRDAGGVVAVANDVAVTHVRGVSSRSRPVFVEWHKHRGLWRYFRKFDASRHGIATRALVFAMIWGRFPFALLKKQFGREV